MHVVCVRMPVCACVRAWWRVCVNVKKRTGPSVFVFDDTIIRRF